VRPRVLPQPPAAQMSVGAGIALSAGQQLRCAGARLSAPRRLGAGRGARAPRRCVAAGLAAGARGRQVAGGVPHHRATMGHRAARGSAAAAPTGGAAGRGGRRVELGARAIATKASEIRFVHARRVWDSRGRPTVEAEVRTLSGAVGRAIVPAGASRGTREAIDLRDGGHRLGGLDVQGALAHINGEIARSVMGLLADDQVALDERLIELDATPNKSRLGANSTLAVSMAAAHAAAAAHGMPLHQYLGGSDAVLLPTPQVQIFGGGAHAGRRTDVQDYMVVCPGAKSF